MTEANSNKIRRMNSNECNVTEEMVGEGEEISKVREVIKSGVLSKSSRSCWDEILEEGDQKLQEIVDYIQSKKEPIRKSCFIDTEADYMKERVFPQLLPALEQALTKARIWNAFKDPKCFFNGLDHVAQEIWNNNPQHPERRETKMHIFNMPWARDILKDKPRSWYPKSWLWPEGHAATVIQTHWRQYLVQREENVEEMRDFWRKLKLERNNPNIASNPLLMKKFASSRELHDPRHPDSSR